MYHVPFTISPPRGGVRGALIVAGLLLLSLDAASQNEDKENQLTLDLNMMSRGEIRGGGITPESEDVDNDKSSFILGRSRLIVGYETPWLEAKLNVQHSGIWGQAGKGSVNIYEGWAKLKTKFGLFAQLGRQSLSYDDERIIGANDWSMTGFSHDVLRLGYEGHGHKAHALFAYNQNASNVTSGTTYYANGAYPYKTMQTAWYHYDLPHTPLGASLLFMNIGMQGGTEGSDEKVFWQQVLGCYVKFSPKMWSLEGSFYKQMGKSEVGIKIDAWMASVKGQFSPSRYYGFEAGFDYLSGDEYFAVPPKSAIGLVRHDVIRGFSSIYGSHNQFYGAMDFFYLKTYVNGFTPGLQNLYVGGYVKPLKGLKVSLDYHYYAMSTKLPDMDMTLGHEFGIEASYQIIKDAKVSAGFSYMTGTETMERLKRASQDGSLRWGWLSVNISPRIFTTKW